MRDCRKPFVNAVLLFLGLLVGPFGGSLSHGTEVDIFQGRIDGFIYGDVYTVFGKTESEVILRIGEPLRRVIGTFPNLHVPDTTNTYIQLYYRELSIDLLHSGATGADLLLRVHLEDPGYSFSGGLGVGSLRDVLEAYLGPADRSDGSGSLVYGDAEGNSTVTFTLEKDRVKSITWSYYYE